MNTQEVMQRPFDLETHKKVFINYLEVVILEDGRVEYAVPSHQEKLIHIACEKLNITREELYDLTPKEYYGDWMEWLCMMTSCVSIWNKKKAGKPNEAQLKVIETLKKEGLYSGE